MLPFPSPLLLGPSGAGGAGSSFQGALVYKLTGNQTIGSTPTAITWDTEAYDATGWHDLSSNTSRLTVPSGVSLVELACNLNAASNNEVLIQHNKNGAGFVGMGKGDSFGGGTDFANIGSAPLAVSASDYFETLFSNSGSFTPGGDEEAWFSIAALDAATRYALVTKSASQSIPAGANTKLTWDTETADTSGFHDNVTNNTRLTVPSGVSLVRIRANVCGGNVTGQLQLSALKNAGSANGLVWQDCDTPTEENVNLVSPPLEVVAGDFFEAQIFFTTATSVPSANNVWFSIEEVKMPASYQRALVNKSANQTISANTLTILTWDQEVYDTASIHDNATNNSRLTVPAGCTKARPIMNIVTSSAASEMSVFARKNGASYFGMPRYTADTAGTDSLNAVGAWVDVTPGDYFEVIFYSFGGCSVSTHAYTWFCLECQ